MAHVDVNSDVPPTVRLVRGGLEKDALRAVPPELRAPRRLPATPLLALVLGPRVAFGLRWDDGRVASGIELFELRHHEGPGERAVRFQAFVRDVLDIAEPGLVVWVAPAAPLTFAQEALLHVEVEGRTSYVTTSGEEVRRHAASRPHLGAPGDLVQAARSRWLLAVHDEQEAEALCLLAWAADTIGEELVPQ